MQTKAETQFQIISTSDAQHVLDFLPAITAAVKDDPKYRNRRAAYLNAQSSVMQAFSDSDPNRYGQIITPLRSPAIGDKHLELLKVLKRRTYPLAFKDEATNEDILHVI